MGKEAKTDAGLEDMILQRLVIGGVFVSVGVIRCSVGVRRSYRPKHTMNAQELADRIATDCARVLRSRTKPPLRGGIVPRRAEVALSRLYPEVALRPAGSGGVGAPHVATRLPSSLSRQELPIRSTTACSASAETPRRRVSARTWAGSAGLILLRIGGRLMRCMTKSLGCVRRYFLFAQTNGAVTRFVPMQSTRPSNSSLTPCKTPRKKKAARRRPCRLKSDCDAISRDRR